MENYVILYGNTDDKLAGEIIFGRIMIYVDTDDQQKALATADEVGRQLIDSKTLDSVQIFAFTSRRDVRSSGGAMSDKNGTAWVSYSNTSKFQPEWANWVYEIPDPATGVPSQTSFDRSSWLAPADFPNASVTVRRMCDDLTRCEFGTDPRL